MRRLRRDVSGALLRESFNVHESSEKESKVAFEAPLGHLPLCYFCPPSETSWGGSGLWEGISYWAYCMKREVDFEDVNTKGEELHESPFQ
eukprot:TCALIF_03446-PA protein Name:"Protein of unknown function" AED:0.60 eAED:0.60 QI:17/0/0.5/0.5/0/0/2/117/89